MALSVYYGYGSIPTPVLLVVEDELPLLQSIVLEAGKAGL